MKKTFRKEADVKAAVKEILAQDVKEGSWYFMPSMNGYGRAGVPDFIVCHRGCLIGIETKFGSNKPTPAQKMELSKIYYARGLSLIINESNVHKLREVLDFVKSGLFLTAQHESVLNLKEYGIEV